MPDKRFDQVTTDDVGGHRVPGTGATGGSASAAYASLLTETVLSVWDASIEHATGGALIGAPKSLVSLDVTFPGASAAYDGTFMVLGLSAMPAAFTYEDYRNAGMVVVPPTRIARAAADNGALLPQWLHSHPIYVLVAVATTAHAGAGKTVKFGMRFQNASDRVL